MDRLRNPQQVKPLGSSFYQVRLLTVWTGVTIICIVFTIIYAYNATRASPFWPGILPSDPSQTIRILNILSHVTVFLLQTLTAGLFETIRWVFAARNGVTAFTFISLSSGTSYLGVLYLLFRRANRSSNWRTSHHVWGFATVCVRLSIAIDRSIFFLLLHLGLGFALLAEVSFQVTWTDVVSTVHFNNAGLSPFNTSIIDLEGLNNLPVFFWATFPSVLSDGRYVTSAPPYTDACKSNSTCTSIFLPGGRSLLSPAPTRQNASATALVVHDAPGAQIEFYAMSPSDPPLSTTDCHVYGYAGQGIQLCVKSVGNDFIAGLSPTAPFYLLRI